MILLWDAVLGGVLFDLILCRYRSCSDGSEKGENRYKFFCNLERIERGFWGRGVAKCLFLLEIDIYLKLKKERSSRVLVIFRVWGVLSRFCPTLADPFLRFLCFQTS